MGALFKNKLLLLIVIGVVVAGIAWYSFLGGSEPQPLLTTQDVITENAPDSDVVRTLLTLRSVSLSGTVFADPAFMTLQDFGREIIQEPVGRPNPFAPIGIQIPQGQSQGQNPNSQNTGGGVRRPIAPAPVQ